MRSSKKWQQATVLLARYAKPQYFDDLYCNLVESGEQSGALETLLDRVATYKEKTEALKAKIKKAMTYPIAVIVVAIIISAILLIKVVPQFESVFQGFGAELPAFTMMVVGLSRWLQEWWYLVAGALFAAAFLSNTPISGRKISRCAR